jgi:hypothetical protein
MEQTAARKASGVYSSPHRRGKKEITQFDMQSILGGSFIHILPIFKGGGFLCGISDFLTVSM